MKYRPNGTENGEEPEGEEARLLLRHATFAPSLPPFPPPLSAGGGEGKQRLVGPMGGEPEKGERGRCVGVGHAIPMEEGEKECDTLQ